MFRNAIKSSLKHLCKKRTLYPANRRHKIALQLVYYSSTREVHTNVALFKRRKTPEERKVQKVIEYSPKTKAETIGVWRDITAGELGKILNKDMNYIRELFLNQVKTPNTIINDLHILQHAIQRSGHRMKIIGKPLEILETEDQDVYPRKPASKELLEPRPPVVTVMGHVDHGKTTLLDALRHSNVVEQEFGGITQHIGAFSVLLNIGNRITFLDTPGHAAFTSMRERGANVTDLVVIVVAADDGVMEQTVESLRMARQAQVPIMIAINKIDSPKADIERTQNMLLEYGIQVEKLGGDVQAVPISALKRKNLDALTEALVLQAELLEIKSDPTGPVEAVCIESKVHPHRGKLCTIIVKRGTLRNGAVLIADIAMGRVRTMKDSEGKILDQVPPGYPAEIEGWKDLPSAGDLVLEVESEKKARQVIKIRQDKQKEEKSKEELGIIKEKRKEHEKEYQDKLMMKRKIGRLRLRNQGPRKPESSRDDDSLNVNLIIKGDVDGSVEAILGTIDTYDSNLCNLELVHYGVGALTENDIELAQTFDGIIYAFNVDCPPKIRKLAEESNAKIKFHNVIYKLVDDIKEEINSKLPPVETEEVLGEATVLQQFEITQGRKKIPVAGCRCTKGVLKKSGIFKLVRDMEIIHTGRLVSMRHLKDEVGTIKTNVECGLQLEDKLVEFKNGDILRCIEKKLVPQQTDWDPGF